MYSGKFWNKYDVVLDESANCPLGVVVHKFKLFPSFRDDFAVLDTSLHCGGVPWGCLSFTIVEGSCDLHRVLKDGHL